MSISQDLTTLGFRADNAARLDAAIRNFQRGWNLGDALVVDGIAGPKTMAAMSLSIARHKIGQGTASAHFSFSEFACKCGGKFAACQRIHMLRQHIMRLESLRLATGPISIVSGFRCQDYNHSIGGATNSQHMYGVATDIPGTQTIGQMLPRHLFAGLGFNQSNNRVVHVDSRDQSINNTTRSSVTNPATWKYAE